MEIEQDWANTRTGVVSSASTNRPVSLPRTDIRKVYDVASTHGLSLLDDVDNPCLRRPHMVVEFPITTEAESKRVRFARLHAAACIK